MQNPTTLASCTRLAVRLSAGLAATLIFAALNAGLSAQQPGRIVGRVLDEATGQPVPGAQVRIEGTVFSAVAALDGRYTLLSVPPGSTDLTVRAIGYAPSTVAGLIVPAGGVVYRDIQLNPRAVQLAEIAVSTRAERGTVDAALEEQRTSLSVTSSVTAEQIARSPDGDAGQAIQRMSGVTVHDGRYVFVRGLGERYTQTSLNRSRLPSAEPERRTVPLDLFPSNLLEGINTAKTFTPDQPGDFTGGQVDLRTREFVLGRRFAVTTSLGFSPGLTGHTVPGTHQTGSEWLGFAGRSRAIPPEALGAGDLAGRSLDDLRLIIGGFRNAWSARPRTSHGAAGFNLSLGGEDPILGQLVGYVASFGYSLADEVRRDEERALAVTGETPGSTRAQNRYTGRTVTSSVLWGGLVNLNARIGASSRIAFNNTFTRSADDQATRLSGYNEEFARDFDITRLTFIERAMRSHQITGQHLLFGRHTFEWQATASAVFRREPDRSDLIYEAVTDSATGGVRPTAWFGVGRSAGRAFSDLTERTTELGASYRIEFGPTGRTALKFGVLLRDTRREADSRGFYILNYDLSDTERSLPAESVFAHPERLTLAADANVGRYTASDRVNAGFVLVEFPVNSHLRFISGVRTERWDLDLLTRSVSGQLVAVHRRNTDYLPALSLVWALGPDRNLRFAFSQTLSRPEYREMAPITSRDIAGGLDFFGDSSLTRSLVQNVDLRWEWYPDRGEVVSVAVFAKRFHRPIERILVGTTGATTASYANADAAHNLGVELELRRGLGALSRSLDPFSLMANVTLMSSEIRSGAADRASMSSVNRPMVGQAGYVLNLGLGYTSPTGSTSATLLYNVVGRRIHEAGTVLLPDAWEEPRHMLDLSLRLPGPLGMSLKLDARNLLDAPYRITQGEVTRLFYRTGRALGIGLSWQR